MTARPQPPPEARLIAQRRSALIPKLSMRQAAQRMGVPFSAARWRQLESGIRRVAGTDFPETGPPETIARMARVVGVSSDELAECGRADAAQLLAELPPMSTERDELTEIRRRFADLERKQVDDSRHMEARFEAMQRQMAAEFEDKLKRALADREPRDKEDDINETGRKRRAI